MGVEMGERDICIGIVDTHCYKAELTQHCKPIIFQLKKQNYSTCFCFCLNTPQSSSQGAPGNHHFSKPHQIHQHLQTSGAEV